MVFFKTQSLLKDFGIVPNKKMGQNFMVDFSIFQKLSEYASLLNIDTVLDCGAGLGFLTKFLAKRCKSVLAVEKDYNLIKILKKQLKSFNNVSIIKGDLLTVDLPKFNKIISIPPYYLSSDLIQWLFRQKFNCAVMIMQDAFAKRLSASPNSDDYSWLTVFTQYYGKVDLLDIILPEKFYPKPDIASRIVRITPLDSKFLKDDQLHLFNLFIKHLFVNRNKKLINPVHSFLKTKYNFSKIETQKFLLSFSFREKRVRQLMVKNFGELFDAIPK